MEASARLDGLIGDPTAAGDAPLRSVPLDPATVYAQYGDTVLRWAVRLGGPDIDHQDVVQEVFLRVSRYLGKFRGDSRLTTWLYRLTANEVYTARRRLRWRQWLGGSAEDVAGELASHDMSADRGLERQQKIALTYEILDKMKEKYRTVLILFELEELSGEEIARLLDVKLNTVWVWLHRARADFARRAEAAAAAGGGR